MSRNLDKSNATSEKRCLLQYVSTAAVCRPTSPQLQSFLFFGSASKLIFFPDHFLPVFGLVLYIMHSGDLAVLYLSHSK